MGSTGWNPNGDTIADNNILWGAVRKGILNYGGTLRSLTKLTLNGMTYDFQKQAKEGQVVIGGAYKCVTFFLPEYREQVQLLARSTPSIRQYFWHLSDGIASDGTQYSDIPAWDSFADWFAGALRENGLETTMVTFKLTNQDGTASYSGQSTFGHVVTAADFWRTLYDNMDPAADESLVTDWQMEDGAVYAEFYVDIGYYNKTLPLIIGRK